MITARTYVIHWPQMGLIFSGKRSRVVNLAGPAGLRSTAQVFNDAQIDVSTADKLAGDMATVVVLVTDAHAHLYLSLIHI